MSEEPQPIAAAELFRAHAGFVAGFAVRLGAPKAAIDDVVQDVFLTAHKRGGFVPGAARATTWLAEITFRVVSNERRRSQRQRVEPDDEAVAQVPASASGPDDQTDTKHALGRVQQALDALDDDRRAVFVLFELEGESCEDIGAALGIPVGTVYSRIHHARQQFKRAYARLEKPSRPVIVEQPSEGGVV